MLRRLPRLALLPLCVCAFAILSGGCGQSLPPMKVDDAVQATEDALTALLLGGDPDVTSIAPRDKPILVKGVHDTVYVAADAEGFHTMSRGAFTLASIAEIEERVVKTVGSNVRRHGFSAHAAAFPTILTPDQQSHALIATLQPALQESGSPQDRATGKSKTLVLIRLIVSDAPTGAVLAERDYYSGNDVRRPNGTEHFRAFH